MVAISGADPLNLIGSVLPGDRVPALTGARILFRDGIPVATLIAKQVNPLVALQPGDEWAFRKLLLRDHSRPGERMRPQLAEEPEVSELPGDPDEG
jgi:ATP-dependent Lhr-like helicase